MSPAARPKKPAGSIALVGAGAGSAGLLTLRAVELLEAADVVVAHPAVADEVVDRAAGEVLRSDAVADAVAASKDGKRVVRLLPGDVLTSAAGVAEAEAVVKAKQRLEVVPGVPGSVAGPAFAGLAAGGVRTVAAVDETTDVRPLAAAPGALVLETAAGFVGKLAGMLVEHGRKAEAPVTVTAGVSGVEQRTVVTTLEAADRDTAELSGDVVVVLGDPAKKAVSSGQRLSWYESRPLYGWRVLVPRTREQAGALSEALRAHGALPVEVPTIAVEPPRTPAQMEKAVKGLVTGRYQWVAFTSTNAVKAVVEKLREFGLDARSLSGVKVACVGDATAAAVRAFGVEPELVPSGQQSSEGLLAEWQEYDEVFDPIDRVLLPRADIATDTLLAGLQELGWQVDDVTAYRTVRAAPPPAETREALKGGGFDAVLFTSSSTVRNLVGIAGKPHDTTVIACIGPMTVATAEEHGLRVDVVASKPEVVALVESLAEFAAQREGDLPSAARRKKLAAKAKR